MAGRTQAQKRALTAYRVKRKLLGQSGAPTVTVTQEFWRYKQQARDVERCALDAYIDGRQRGSRNFGSGSRLWTRGIFVDVDGVIKAPPFADNTGWQPVGRIFRDAVVIHRKKAPRWLLNWARYRSNVYVLGGISRRALRAHLVKEKLLGQDPF